MAKNDKARYKLLGTKNQGEQIARVVLEGSTSNPKRWIDLDGRADLTESEVERLRRQGLILHKVGEATGDKTNDEPSVAKTKEQQQAAQVASGAQHPAVDPDKDNTPGGDTPAGN